MRTVVVIPAYNEIATVGEVVRVARSCSGVSEVVVVDDGSTDATALAATSAGARVVVMPQNQGKGAAMWAGVREAGNAEVILFLDADLIGLTVEHVRALLDPVISGQAEMTIGIFKIGRFSTDLAQVVAPYLSGQRAIRRRLLESMPDLEISRFGVEVALTRYARRSGIRVLDVMLPGASHRMKEEKLGLVQGFLARMKMYWEIIKYAQRG